MGGEKKPTPAVPLAFPIFRSTITVSTNYWCLNLKKKRKGNTHKQIRSSGKRKKKTLNELLVLFSWLCSASSLGHF